MILLLSIGFILLVYGTVNMWRTGVKTIGMKILFFGLSPLMSAAYIIVFADVLGFR
jgi:hypothetical protein